MRDFAKYFLLGMLAYFLFNYFMPMEVKADSYVFNGNYYAAKANNVIVTGKLTLEDLQGRNYYRYNTTGVVSTFYISYNTSSLVDYDYFSFVVRTASVPVVTANSEVCEVYPGYYSLDNLSYTGFSGVICKNIGSPFTTLDFILGTDPSSSSFWISQDISFYKSPDVDRAIQDIQTKVNDVNNSVNKVDDSINKANESINKVGDSVNNVNDTLNDGSIDTDGISSIGGNLPGTNGVLSSILNMPVRFFSILLNSFDTTSCPSFSFTIPFVNQNCSIPCFRSILSDIGALTWYEGIGGLVGGLLIFTYIIHLGKTFHKMGDLDDTGNESWGGL